MAVMTPIRQPARVSGPGDAAAIMGPHIAFAPHEHLAIAYLCPQQKMLHLSITTSNAASYVKAPLRNIIADAIACNADSLVLAHNHPSGIAAPSQDDRELTQLIARTLRPLGIRLQDHLIFAGRDWTSLRAQGLL